VDVDVVIVIVVVIIIVARRALVVVDLFRFARFGSKFACCCSRVILHLLFSIVLVTLVVVVAVVVVQPNSISRSLYYLLLPSFALVNVQAIDAIVVVDVVLVRFLHHLSQQMRSFCENFFAHRSCCSFCSFPLD